MFMITSWNQRQKSCLFSKSFFKTVCFFYFWREKAAQDDVKESSPIFRPIREDKKKSMMAYVMPWSYITKTLTYCSYFLEKQKKFKIALMMAAGWWMYDWTLLARLA